MQKLVESGNLEYREEDGRKLEDQPFHPLSLSPLIPPPIHQSIHLITTPLIYKFLSIHSIH
jgi:glutamate mutase epsilon subunit